MKDYLLLLDENTNGQRCDVTPIFADPSAFGIMVEDLVELLGDLEIDLVAGIDALGFILATALAIKLNKGLITIRKGGKLPCAVLPEEFVDYSGQKKSLELRKGMIQPGQHILIVDEWIETGAQIRAAIKLIEREGGHVAGVATINMDINDSTEELSRNYSFFTLR